jgi:hypothetical protein
MMKNEETGRGEQSRRPIQDTDLKNHQAVGKQAYKTMHNKPYRQ